MKSPSTISTTTIVRGNVSGDGSLEVLGRVEGSISMTGQVIIAPNAVVKGNVSATEIQVAGSILGNLTASDLLMLNTGARVVGDLAGARIGVAEGALVRGLVRTEGEPPLAQPAPPVPTRAASPIGKPAMPGKPAFTAPSMARPAPAVMAPKPAAAAPVAPKPVPIPAPPVAVHTYERPVAQEPVQDVEDELELDEPTNPPPPPQQESKQERSAHAAPPMVVPAIKGQVKATKKKHKGR